MTKFRRVVTFAIAIPGLMIFWQNCGKFEAVDLDKASSSSGGLVSDAFFKKVNSQILQSKCVTCHSTAVPGGGIDYSNYQKTMSTGSVVAGSPSASTLLSSVINGSMPQGGARLNVTEINLISAWIAAGAKENELPVVSAGSDQSSFLGSGINLSGSAQDPDGVIVSYAWSQVSGPSSAVLANANAAVAATANLMLGTYVFRLTVTDDSGATVSDDLSVTVSQPMLLSSLNSTIFQSKCLGCHSNSVMLGNYNMATYNLLMKDVVAGNPNASKLYMRVIDNSMPPGAPLTQTEKDNIRTWIAQGALNN